MYTVSSNKRRRTRGLSLVETIASVGILTIGIASVVGGMGALARGEAHARQMEIMTALAQHKYEELVATSQNLTTSQNGDFTDENNSDYTWSADINQTGETNLTYITVTVSPTIQSGVSSPQAKVTGLIYYNQNGTTTSTTTTPAGGGAAGGGARPGG